MRLHLTAAGAKFKCSKYTTSISVLMDIILYDGRMHLPYLIDLMYFWAKDIILPLVCFKTDTSSNKTIRLGFRNLALSQVA
jgi:hypothetical protein